MNSFRIGDWIDCIIEQHSISRNHHQVRTLLQAVIAQQELALPRRRRRRVPVWSCH